MMSKCWPIVCFVCLTACQSSPTPQERREDPEKIAALNTQLAIQYIQEAQYDIALKRIEKALAADPRHVDAFNAQGLLYNRLGESEKAESSFKRAIRIEPDNSGALNNYGLFLCSQKRYDEGIELLTKAIANPLYRNPEIAYGNAGNCALRKSDNTLAENYFRQALEINPNFAAVLLEMSKLFFSREDFLRARAYMQRYQTNANHTAETLWLAVRIERGMGDKDAAASYALRLEKAFPDAIETRSLLDSESP
ncbi:MAG: type IV pilus biogenesis/stability protein PilW [Pseudomonadota bacterium]